MRKTTFRLAISLSFLLYLGIGVDWLSLAAVFRQVGVLPYVLSTGFAISSTIFIAGKYRLFIKGTPIALPLKRLVAINFISRFYALFLPSAIGPEAIRWYKVTKNKKGRSFFLAATMAERLFFLLILLLCTLIPFLLRLPSPDLIIPQKRLAPILAACLLGVAFGMLFFYFPCIQQRAKHRIIKIIEQVGLSPGLKIFQFMKNFEIQPPFSRLFLPLLLLSAAWQTFFLLRIFFLFRAIGVSIPFIDVVWMGSFVMLLQVLPVTLAGLGLREGAYAFFLSLYGFPPETGIAIGLLFFSQMLIFAAIGALLNLTE